jgi:TRAP-type mannitol/chloroaromatic compound transport system substrate-binding protein
MKRRDVLTGLAAGGALLAGCKPETPAEAKGAAAPGEKFQWKMYTTWPRNFPGLGTGANRAAELITRMSGGRLRVTVYGAGERVPALEVFDAVSRGSAQMGHAGSYYWKGKAEAAPFFTSIPFGFTAQEMNAWLYFGGGMELWRELYAPFNLVPFACGNSGTQMGGWFRKPIRSLSDLRGLKMRIPGLGGEVLARLGVTTVNIPGGELFTSLSSGAIDATEWVGPYNDLAFGLYKAAKFYHYPGWHEPGSTLEAFVNKAAWDALPEDLQAIVSTACEAVNTSMLAEMTARNQQALHELVSKHGVQLLPFPEEVLAAIRKTSDQLLSEMAGRDAFTKKVHDSYSAFRQQVVQNTRIAELAFLRARG